MIPFLAGPVGPVGPDGTLSSSDPAGILFPAVAAGMLFPAGPVGPVGTLSPSDDSDCEDPRGLAYEDWLLRRDVVLTSRGREMTNCPMFWILLE